jgi:isocitrate dehydrogenase kinase/phosphatase
VVKRKFTLVKEADRVGRMVDALEFEDLALPYDRFAPELLADLEALAPSMLIRDGDRLIVRHCYVERRLTPLDVYLRQATPEQLDHALREFGDAVRELADVNIFTGDMFFKNFGLNRHGRVVFYDYDEIEYVTDCVFRELPDDPFGSEVAVTHLDVFPAEIATFLLGRPPVREAFLRYHEEILDPAFWRERQRLLAAGETADFFPYPESARFRSTPGP